MTFLVTFAAAAVVSLGSVGVTWWMVNRSQNKYREHMIDREYERLCQDPRYKVR